MNRSASKKARSRARGEDDDDEDELDIEGWSLFFFFFFCVLNARGFRLPAEEDARRGREEEEDDDDGEEAVSASKGRGKGKKTKQQSNKKKKKRSEGRLDLADDEGDDGEGAASASKAGKGGRISSKGKKTKQKRKSGGGLDFDDDDDDEGDDDDADSNWRARKFGALPAEEQATLVGELVRFALLMQRERHTVSRAKITSIVLGDKYKKMPISGELIKRASAICSDLFGLKLQEAGAEVILVNEIPLHDPYKFLGWKEPTELAGLAVVVMGMIHCTPKGELSEEDLFAALSALGFRQGNQEAVFGDWQARLGDLVKQRYIAKCKSKTGARDDWVYTLGKRAEVESNLEKLEGLVSTIYRRPVDPSRIEEKKLERGLIDKLSGAATERAESDVPEKPKRGKSQRKGGRSNNNNHDGDE